MSGVWEIAPRVQDEERESRRERLARAANPFEDGGYVPRVFPTVRAQGEGRETWTVPVHTLVPMCSPTPPVPAKPVRQAKTKAASTPRAPRPENTKGYVPVVLRKSAAGGWTDMHTGLVVSEEAMSLVTRMYVGQKKPVKQIASETSLSADLVRAILRVNRIPTQRQGRGPQVRPASPRRTA